MFEAMTTTKKAAATYVGFTIEEFDKYVKRAFRAFKPTQTRLGNEFAYILNLSERIKVLIQSSIHTSGQSAESGTDPIRVGFMYAESAGGRLRPLKGGSFPIVKRTENWRDNLEDRVNDYLEEYESNRGTYKDTF